MSVVTSVNAFLDRKPFGNDKLKCSALKGGLINAISHTQKLSKKLPTS